MTGATPVHRPVVVRARALSVVAGVCAMLAQSPAHAQFSGPPSDQPDTPLTASLRATTVDSLAAAVERYYVFPDVANRTAAALRAKLKKGGYNGVAGASALADSLTLAAIVLGKALGEIKRDNDSNQAGADALQQSPQHQRPVSVRRRMKR